MPLPIVLFLGFSIAVTTAWFRHHLFVLPDDWVKIGFPLAAYALLVAGLALWLLIKKRTASFRLPRFALPLAIFGLAVFIFNTQSFLLGLIPGYAPVLPFGSWTEANLSFAAKLGALGLVFALLTLGFSATGNLIIRRIKGFETGNAYGFLIRLTIGMSLWIGFLVLFGTLDILGPAAIWTTLIVILIRERRFLGSCVRWLRITDEWRFDPKHPLVFVSLIILFLFALNLSEAVRPDPVGYDDMTWYMNRANLMAEKEALVAGGNPYPFELLAAGIRIASGDDSMFLALSLGVYGLFFGIVTLYCLGRFFFGERAGVIAAAILFSLPMGPALALAETKPDAILLPVATLFFWSLLRWLRMKNSEDVYFSAFLLGLAISIKLTAAFFIAPVLLALMLAFADQRSQFIRPFRHTLFAAIFFLLPLAPWAGYGFSTRAPGQSAPLFQVLSSFPDRSIPTLHQDMSALLGGTSCTGTAAREDFARFEKGERSTISRYFFLPWDLTMNLMVTSFATEIGFLFLAILPILALWGFSLIRKEKRTLFSRPTAQLMLFAVGYFLLWTVFAKFIPWYGYPGLAILALLVAQSIEYARPKVFLFRFFIALLMLGLVGNTLVRMKFSGTPERLRYAAGAISAEEFLDTTFPGLFTLKSGINRDPETRFYLTGSRLWYAFDDNQRRGYSDGHLDAFNCLLETYGPEGTMERLRGLQIRYFFFSRTLLQELGSEESNTFQTKVRRFTDFAGKHLRVVWGSRDYMLFELPIERSR